MPYKSQAQRAYFNANRAKMEHEGVNVDEWNQASKGRKLPPRAKPKSKAKGKPAPAKKKATPRPIARKMPPAPMPMKRGGGGMMVPMMPRM